MTVEGYIKSIPVDQREAFQKLRKVVAEGLPEGFVEIFNYGMITYAVPHSLYPKGYHCNPKDPLPFLSIAAQKASINLYHMGLYASEDLMRWFLEEFSKLSRHKVDIGKSCVRFKYYDEIPYELIRVLVGKISAGEWIATYESKYENRK